MKQRVIILLLGICMITTLVVGCGNSKNRESEKENVNESEAVTEIESELGTEIESELTETEVETETTESQDTETKVEDTTSSEQTANKPSSDKGQSGSGSTNSKPQNNNNNSKPSGDVYDNGWGEMVSSNPELCSHGHGITAMTDSRVTTYGDIIEQYSTGAYTREVIDTFKQKCMWCDKDMGYKEERLGQTKLFLDKVTDYAGEFARGGVVNDGLRVPQIVPYAFQPRNINEIGAELVKKEAGVIDTINVTVDFDTDDYVIFISKVNSNNIITKWGYDSKGNVYDDDDWYEFVTTNRYEYMCYLYYGSSITIFVNSPY